VIARRAALVTALYDSSSPSLLMQPSPVP
jgi:hypothetical protein